MWVLWVRSEDRCSSLRTRAPIIATCILLKRFDVANFDSRAARSIFSKALFSVQRLDTLAVEGSNIIGGQVVGRTPINSTNKLYKFVLRGVQSS